MLNIIRIELLLHIIHLTTIVFHTIQKVEGTIQDD